VDVFSDSYWIYEIVDVWYRIAIMCIKMSDDLVCGYGCYTKIPRTNRSGFAFRHSTSQFSFVFLFFSIRRQYDIGIIRNGDDDGVEGMGGFLYVYMGWCANVSFSCAMRDG